jgi:hypothetical protein
LNELDRAILRYVNLHRKYAGLQPVMVDANLSGGCIAHAKYLVLHERDGSVAGLSAHSEIPGSVGYSKKGHEAGSASVIASSDGGPARGWPVSAVDGWMNTFFHRVPILNPGLRRIGIGYATDLAGDFWEVVLDVKSGAETWDEKLGTEPIVYPAPGQTSIPRKFAFGSTELPSPFPGGANRSEAGCPITATFPPGVAVTGVTATLTRELPKGTPAFVANEVHVWLSSPEHPTDQGARYQLNTICLIPQGIMAPNTVYTVSSAARVNGQEWSKTWRFTTVEGTEYRKPGQLPRLGR